MKDHIFKFAALSFLTVSACSTAPTSEVIVWDYDRANAECHRLGTGSSHQGYNACLARFGAYARGNSSQQEPLSTPTTQLIETSTAATEDTLMSRQANERCEPDFVWTKNIIADRPGYLVWQQYRYEDCSETMEIYVNSEFTFELLEDLRWAVSDAKQAGWLNEGFELWFNSPGGLVDVGVALALMINDLDIATGIYDGDTCESACSIAFMAGEQRVMLGNAKLGIHSAYGADTGKMSDVSNTKMSLIASLIGGDASGIYEKIATTTAPGEMFYLNKEQAEAFNLAGDRRSAWLTN